LEFATEEELAELQWWSYSYPASVRRAALKVSSPAK
jgi:hypothetical protein